MTGSIRLLVLTVGVAIFLAGVAPPQASAFTPPSRGSSVSAKAKLHSAKKKKKHRRVARKNRRIARQQARRDAMIEKSYSVLRTYLPEYEAICKAKTDDFDQHYVPLAANFDLRSPFALPALRTELLASIADWLGTRYRFGGSSKRGVDCSGFTSAIVHTILDERVARSSQLQAGQFQPIFDTDSLQFGDMVFFAGRNRKANRIGHAGIYLGNGVFAHSSTGRGVIFTHISEGYYSQRFRWGGRFVNKPALPPFVTLFAHP